MFSPPTAATRTPEEEELLAEKRRAAPARALRRFVSRHNWQALTLALVSLVSAVVMWGLVYLFAYWFNLIVATVSRGFSSDNLQEINSPGLVSKEFPLWFLCGAVLALFAAAVVRRRMRLESLREARYYLLWVIVELLMALPNLTFSIWGNLSAIVHLPARDAEDAWRLLERLHHDGGRLNVSSLRLEIEDVRVLERVMFVLQIVGLADMRERQEGWFFCLQNRDAFTLLSRAGAL